MTVVLQNVKDENLALLRELAKMCKMKIKLQKSKDENLLEDIKLFEEEDRTGKTKIYDSLEDFKKAMNA